MADAIDKPASTGDNPAGTDMAAEAGTSPAKKMEARAMHYIRPESGTQKPHPAKQAQGNTLRHLG
jgi:hypothetical protein